jgi:putative DNA primase/helicase
MGVGYIQFVARELLSRADFLIPQWLPDGKRVGDEWVARNPTRQDAHLGSFKVNLRTGEWADFATGEKGTDLVSVFAHLNHLSQGEAAKRLAEAHGLNNKPYSARSGAESKAMWKPLAPIPANAPPPPQAHPKQGKPSRSWTYRNEQGAVLCHVLRFDPPEGKQIVPLTYCRNEKGETAWRWQGLPKPRPLYNLDQLNANPNAVVVLTEGEKAADAAAALFPEYVTTTTLNGAQSPHKTDFTPLAGRTVWLMPDNDKPGQSYVEKVAKLIPRGSLFILNLEWLSKKLGKQLSEGYDLADAEADGLTAEDMRQAIEEWQRAHEAYHSPPEAEDITDLVQAQAFINDFSALSKTKQRDKLPSLLEDKALSFIEGVQHKDSNTYK